MRPFGPDGEMPARSIPPCAASRRASGVTRVPPARRAGPKLRSGVRTSKNGSSLIGTDAAAGGAARDAAGTGGALGREGAPVAAGAALTAGSALASLGRLAAVLALSAMTATTAPTGATSPAATRISASTPAEVEGTSIDTLSVSISNRLSPGAMASPADLNHCVILPSATVSPSCGINTSIYAFPISGARAPKAVG